VHDLGLVMREGRRDMPVCIFVHALGMNRDLWISPEQSRLLGGLFPLTVLLRKYDDHTTLYHILGERGFPCAAWSQRRPVGPVADAVEELRCIMPKAAELSDRGMVIIGISRGGLVARAAVGGGHELPAPLRGLITICSPHMGSGMARWASYLSPLASRIRVLIPEAKGKQTVEATRRVLGFIESTAVRELLPGSAFLASLDSAPPGGTYCLSIGGTNPDIIDLPGIRPLRGLIERTFPHGRFPNELRDGVGDGLVTARSAVMPGAHEHLDFHVSHLAALFDPGVKNAVLERIERHCV
jgi:hypothetical protein